MISSHILSAVVLLLAYLAVACSSDSTDAASTPVPSPSPSPTQVTSIVRIETPTATPPAAPDLASASPDGDDAAAATTATPAPTATSDPYYRSLTREPTQTAAQPASGFCSDMKPVPVECQLAVIDKGPVRSNDPALASYRAVLARLERKCRASREQIASGAVASKQLLKERKGVSITALKMLEATDTAIPDGNSLGVSCAEIMSSIVLMTSR